MYNQRIPELFSTKFLQTNFPSWSHIDAFISTSRSTSTTYFTTTHSDYLQDTRTWCRKQTSTLSLASMKVHHVARNALASKKRCASFADFCITLILVHYSVTNLTIDSNSLARPSRPSQTLALSMAILAFRLCNWLSSHSRIEPQLLGWRQLRATWDPRVHFQLYNFCNLWGTLKPYHYTFDWY
jgi:hypothetical protein